MAQQDFANISVFVDGVQLEKLTSVSISTESGQQPVDTLVGGRAGYTPGSGECSINLGFVIPLGGFEFNFQEKVTLGSYHAMQLIIGPTSYNGTGKFMSCEMSQSVNAATEGSCVWTGEVQPFTL